LQAAGLDIGASVPVRLASTAQVRIEGINVRQVTQRVRLLLVPGLPEPAPNVWVGTDHERLAIGDMVYSNWNVIVEYDGFQHLDNRSQWERDIVRLGELADAGWVVIRVTNNQLRCPRQIILRLWRALVAGGYAGPAPVSDGQWSTLFE